MEVQYFTTKIFGSDFIGIEEMEVNGLELEVLEPNPFYPYLSIRYIPCKLYVTILSQIFKLHFGRLCRWCCMQLFRIHN